jgi:hypothetical protein
MLVIVGHGPSVGCVPNHFIDKHTVVRLRHCPKTVGKKTDIICSSQGRHKGIRKTPGTRKKPQFWNLLEYRTDCVKRLQPFKPKFYKPSTGLSAVMIADMKGYEEIAVIGFDYTLHPERLENHKNWRHDLRAEHECLLSYGVIDLEREFCE